MSSSKFQSESKKPLFNYGSPCAACKFLRRRCLPECIFAPHFPADQPQKFEIVHRIYGASNVSKILNQLSYDLQGEAVKSLVYEAEARLNEPAHGCVGFISILQNRLKELQAELSAARTELSSYMISEPQDAYVSVPQPLQMPPVGSSSSSSAMTIRSLRPSLTEQFSMQCLQQTTVDGQSSSQQGADPLLEMPLIDNAVGIGTSYGFNTNELIQPHVVDQKSNVRLHEQRLQLQSFGSQQPATAEQKPPTTIRPPPRQRRPPTQ